MVTPALVHLKITACWHERQSYTVGQSHLTASTGHTALQWPHVGISGPKGRFLTNAALVTVSKKLLLEMS